MNTMVEHDKDTTWLTAQELADRLRVHPKTLLRLATAGLIPCLRAGRVVRFPAELVERELMRRAASA